MVWLNVEQNQSKPGTAPTSLRENPHVHRDISESRPGQSSSRASHGSLLLLLMREGLYVHLPHSLPLCSTLHLLLLWPYCSPAGANCLPCLLTLLGAGLPTLTYRARPSPSPASHAAPLHCVRSVSQHAPPRSPALLLSGFMPL